ncbi:MAG: hypothetical protein ACI4P4_12020 [Faecousia sp.]
MIKNRLATDKVVPETQWSKGFAEIKGGGMKRAVMKNVIGVKSNFSPSTAECEYNAQ